MLKRWGKDLVDVYIDYHLIESTLDVDRWIEVLKQYVKEKKVCVIQSDFSTVGWSERFLTDWFKGNYEKLGFNEITEERTKKYNGLKKQMQFYGFPDFLVKRGTHWERLEIECFSSDYHHGEDYAEIVLCYEKTIDLPVREVIEFKSLNGCETVILDREVWQYLYLVNSAFKEEYDEQMMLSIEKLTEKWSKQND